MKNNLPKIIKENWPDFDWDSKKIWALDIPVSEIKITELEHLLSIPFWEKEGTDDFNLSPIECLENKEIEKSHYSKIVNADISYPIEIYRLDNGKYCVLDGLHRLAKLCTLKVESVKVRILPKDKIKLISKEI